MKVSYKRPAWMSMENNLKKGFILIMSTVLLQYSCDLKAEKTDESLHRYGGTLRWGFPHEPSIINPLYTQSGVSHTILSLVFDSLVGFNESGELKPNLAERWDISQDKLTYTFYLKKGVTFHTGKELTAQDVIFTYEALMNPANESIFYKKLKNIQDITAIDDYTVKIRLAKPFIPFLYTLVSGILPAYLYEKTDLRNCIYNQQPVGTGPFMFERRDADNTIVLKANENYFEGRPFLNQIVFKIYHSQDECYAALLRKEIDLLLFLKKEQQSYLKEDPYFKVFEYPSEYYTALIFKISASGLDDVTLRRAVAYAIDRKSLIERVEEGEGIECKSLFWNDIFSPALKQKKTFDIAKAQALLQEAGWQKNKDGILTRGREVCRLNIAYNSKISPFLRIVQVLRQQLLKTGIQVQAFPYENPFELNQAFVEKKKINTFLRYFSGQDRDPYFALQFLSSEYRGELEYWGYQNDTINDLFRSGLVCMDTKKRDLIYKQIQSLVEKEALLGFLYHPYQFHAIAAHFKNCEGFFNTNQPCNLIKDWYIEQNEERR